MELAFKKLGSGKPVVILHGLFGSSDNWLTVGKELAESYEVFIPDQRNHGESFHSDEFTYDAMAEDLRQFIDGHAIENPVIIGHSMGGKTAMKFATKYPDRFDKMAIVDIGPKAYPVRHRDIIDGLKAIDLSAVETRQQADKQLSEHIPSRPVRQFLLKNLKRRDGGYEWQLNLKIIDEQIENVGEGLENKQYTDKPMLFIRGGKSDYIVDTDSIGIVSLFPNSDIATIPGAGHWVHAEQPEEFLKVIKEFIRKP